MPGGGASDGSYGARIVLFVGCAAAMIVALIILSRINSPWCVAQMGAQWLCP
jgi:hypothetical protein